jgi:hypothetical protein
MNHTDLFNTAIDVTGMHGLAADFEHEHGTADTPDMYEILCDGLRENVANYAIAIAKIAQLTDALRSMVESYDILINDSPVGKNPIAAGVVRGAFIGAIDEARKLVKL